MRCCNYLEYFIINYIFCLCINNCKLQSLVMKRGIHHDCRDNGMRLREKFKTILRDKDGNMAIMFALGGSVLVLAMGVAIDMSSLTGRASKLQSATDAAVLAATVSGEKAPGQLKKIAQTAFEENFDFDEGESLDLFSLKVLSNNELVLKTRLKKPTIFGGVIGKDELFVGAESATIWKTLVKTLEYPLFPFRITLMSERVIQANLGLIYPVSVLEVRTSNALWRVFH